MHVHEVAWWPVVDGGSATEACPCLGPDVCSRA